jgi:hypothetical protein
MRAIQESRSGPDLFRAMSGVGTGATEPAEARLPSMPGKGAYAAPRVFACPRLPSVVLPWPRPFRDVGATAEVGPR